MVGERIVCLLEDQLGTSCMMVAVGGPVDREGSIPMVAVGGPVDREGSMMVAVGGPVDREGSIPMYIHVAIHTSSQKLAL